MAIPVYAAGELRAKIVYCGPGFGGKTTNLEYLHRQLPAASEQERAARWHSVTNQTGERTVGMDLLLGAVRSDWQGWKVRCTLAAVPGQVQYRSSREAELRSADVLVFVADSSPEFRRSDANRYALDEAYRTLMESSFNAAEKPWVFQFNKRDLPGALPAGELLRLVPPGAPVVRAVASAGIGVFETLGAALGLLHHSFGAQEIPPLRPCKD